MRHPIESTPRIWHVENQDSLWNRPSGLIPGPHQNNWYRIDGSWDMIKNPHDTQISFSWGESPRILELPHFSKFRNVASIFSATMSHENMIQCLMCFNRFESEYISQSCISDRWVLRYDQNLSWPQIGNFWGDSSASYSWGRFVTRIMSWNVKDLLGEYFWGQLLEIFMSWNFKVFLGTISTNIYVVKY